MPVSRKSKKNISKKRKNVKLSKKPRKHKYIKKMRGGAFLKPSELQLNKVYNFTKQKELVNNEGTEIEINGNSFAPMEGNIYIKTIEYNGRGYGASSGDNFLLNFENKKSGLIFIIEVDFADDMFIEVKNPVLKEENDILDSDIMYKDDNVSILYPNVKKGILIFTSYNNPEGKDLCIEGLKSGAQLRNEGIIFGRKIYHPYIFFRAPFKYNNDFQYNKSTIDLDIINLGFKKDINQIFIRVDPDHTYVYPSEVRAEFFSNNNEIQSNLQKYKITLSKYLINLNTNRSKLYKHISYEILVELPKLTPDFFVLCNNNEINHDLLSNDEKKKFRETIESESKLYQNKIREDEKKNKKLKNNLKKQTFDANYINQYSVYECPVCKGRGKELDNISHLFVCENKNKTAISDIIKKPSKY
jgi:hypothetical protein